jgi:hypothetical protein
MKIAALAVFAAALAAPAAAADDFDAVVKGVEARYGVRRTRIPLFGVANFVVKVARPGGASGLKLAVFENLSLMHADSEAYGVVDGALGPGWRPFVRVHSRRENESVGIWTNVTGKDLRMLVAALEPGEAAVIEIKIGQRELRRWFEDPAGMAHSRGIGRD